MSYLPLLGHKITRDQWLHSFAVDPNPTVTPEINLEVTGGGLGDNIASGPVFYLITRGNIALGYAPCFPISLLDGEKHTGQYYNVPTVTVGSGEFSTMSIFIHVRKDVTSEMGEVGFTTGGPVQNLTIAEAYSRGLIKFNTFDDFDVTDPIEDNFYTYELKYTGGGTSGGTNISWTRLDVDYEALALMTVDPQDTALGSRSWANPVIRSQSAATEVVDWTSTASINLEYFTYIEDNPSENGWGFEYSNWDQSNPTISEIRMVIAGSEPPEPPTPSDLEARVEDLETAVAAQNTTIARLASQIESIKVEAMVEVGNDFTTC